MVQKIELIPVPGGRSGAAVFRFQLDDIDYCLKTPQHQTASADLQRFRTICQIYQQASIRSLEYLGYGYYATRPFYLYRYIAGENLKTLSNTSYTVRETYQAGVQAGRTLQHLQNLPPQDFPTIPREDLDALVLHGQQLYRQLLHDQMVYRLLQKHQLPPLLSSLMPIFAHAATIFADLSPALIHGDIKRSNIIIDPAGHQHFIDIGAMKVSYAVFNFRYQIIWDLLPENRQRRAFTRGFFDGFFDQQYPKTFHQQIIFISVLNFLEHTTKFSHDTAELDWYFSRVAPLFRTLLTDQRQGSCSLKGTMLQ